MRANVMCEDGGFWGFLANEGDVSPPKRVNDEVSGIETCKFEFSTIKHHYKDILNGILDKFLTLLGRTASIFTAVPGMPQTTLDASS